MPKKFCHYSKNPHTNSANLYKIDDKMRPKISRIICKRTLKMRILEKFGFKFTKNLGKSNKNLPNKANCVPLIYTNQPLNQSTNLYCIL